MTSLPMGKQVLLRHGRYASCSHAGGLSCFTYVKAILNSSRNVNCCGLTEKCMITSNKKDFYLTVYRDSHKINKPGSGSSLL